MTDREYTIEVELGRSAQLDYNYLKDEIGEEFVDKNVVEPTVSSALKQAVDNADELKENKENTDDNDNDA